MGCPQGFSNPFGTEPIVCRFDGLECFVDIQLAQNCSDLTDRPVLCCDTGSSEDKLARKQDLPKELESWTKAFREFLDALHEAGRLTCDQNTHYALNRVQLLGSSGRMTASDGKRVYIHRGFHFPFEVAYRIRTFWNESLKY